MLGNEDVHEHEYSERTDPRDWYTSWRRMSWGAIFAGLFVTLAIFMTLQILGAGIGLSAVDLTGREVTSGKALGIGAATWWLIMGLISLFIGGWVAGRLASLPSKIDRALHGLTTWAFFYVIMFVLATTAMSALVGGGLSLLGKGASAAGQAAASPQGQQALERQGLTPDIIQQEIARLMGAGTTPQGQQGTGNLATTIGNYFRGDKTPQERQELAQVIARDTGKSQDEANRMIDNLEQKAQQAKQTTEQVANVTGGTLIGLAISMILGAVVAVIGSLLAPAPSVPAYRRPTGVRTEAGTYVER
jgi:hypothetical protein